MHGYARRETQLGDRTRAPVVQDAVVVKHDNVRSLRRGAPVTGMKGNFVTDSSTTKAYRRSPMDRRSDENSKTTKLV